MIRLSVLYPNAEGKQFDLTYYYESHMPMTSRLLATHGLIRIEVDRALGGVRGAPAPFACAGHLYFESLDRLQQGLRQCGAELQRDIPNFTDIAPQIQISEVLVLPDQAG